MALRIYRVAPLLGAPPVRNTMVGQKLLYAPIVARLGYDEGIPLGVSVLPGQNLYDTRAAW